MSYDKTYMGIALPLSGDAKMTGKLRIGNTVTGAGDMSSDTAGKGIALTVTAHDNCVLDIYGDDGGTALTAGWVTSIFGSFVQYTAIAGGINYSGFGVTGQYHCAASTASIGNLAGVYGIFETDETVTLAANCFGGLFGAVIPSTVTGSASYWMGGILIGGTNAGGTTTDNFVGIYFQNPGSNVAFDGIFGLDSAQSTAETLTSQTRSFKVRVNVSGTISTYLVPLYDT